MRRILSVDGGGLKGALPAAFLAEIEEATGKRIVDHFDLIAGTSTGGIIAIGLGMGIPAREILGFYLDKGPGIFRQDRPRRWRAEKYLRAIQQIFGSKYSPDDLRAALTGVLGAAKIGDSQTRLLIPAYDSVRRAVHVIKTSHHLRLELDWKLSAVDAALATAAAPTYLPRHVMENAIGLIDGGVWANNPVGPAVVEAATVLKWDISQTKVLSLGCTEGTIQLGASAGLTSVKALIDVMMQGQSFGSQGTASLLLGHPHERQALHRINPVMPASFVALDDASKLEEFVGLGRSEARTFLPTMRSEFLVEPVERFVPFHGRKLEAAA